MDVTEWSFPLGRIQHTEAELIEGRIRELYRVMRDRRPARRINEYMRFLIPEGAFDSIFPDEVEGVYAQMQVGWRAVGEAITANYHKTAQLISDDDLRVDAFPIGPRSKHWRRFREVKRRFANLPNLYWARIKTTWFAADSMPYVVVKRRAFFWPGLGEIPSMLDEMAELRGELAEWAHDSVDGIRQRPLRR